MSVWLVGNCVGHMTRVLVDVYESVEHTLQTKSTCGETGPFTPVVCSSAAFWDVHQCVLNIFSNSTTFSTVSCPVNLKTTTHITLPTDLLCSLADDRSTAVIGRRQQHPRNEKRRVPYALSLPATLQAQTPSPPSIPHSPRGNFARAPHTEIITATRGNSCSEIV